MGKMMDLGKKIGGPSAPETAVNPSKPHVSYPYLSISGKKAIGGKLGSVVNAEVKLKLTSASIEKTKDGSVHRESFDVLGIAPGTMSGESSAEELMEEHEDGGRPNLQGMISSELDKAEKKNAGKKKKTA